MNKNKNKSSSSPLKETIEKLKEEQLSPKPELFDQIIKKVGEKKKNNDQ